jgi:hypothetical protein
MEQINEQKKKVRKKEINKKRIRKKWLSKMCKSTSNNAAILFGYPPLYS